MSEDGYVVSSNSAGDRLFAVIDGHGGREAVDFLEDHLADYVFHEIDTNGDDLELALKRSLERLDRDFLNGVRVERASKKRKRPRRSSQDRNQRVLHAGACVVMTLLREDHVYCCNAGDCRAVLGFSSSLVVPLSRDHKASSSVEMSLLMSLCKTDPVPVRRTKNVKESNAKSFQHLPLRVAGSLAVTRAVGDAYLKLPDLSYPPYDAHVPYLSYPCNGEVISRNIGSDSSSKENGIVLILASDGLWDFVSSDEAIGLCQMIASSSTTTTCQGLASKILDHTLESIASSFRISQDKLKRFKPGKKRRKFHDDITILVVRLS